MAVLKVNHLTGLGRQMASSSSLSPSIWIRNQSTSSRSAREPVRDHDVRRCGVTSPPNGVDSLRASRGAAA
jgi:hypothetical protein